MFSEGTAEEGHKNAAWAKRRPKCHHLAIKRENVANLLEAYICGQVLQYAKCKRKTGIQRENSETYRQENR